MLREADLQLTLCSKGWCLQMPDISSKFKHLPLGRGRKFQASLTRSHHFRETALDKWVMRIRLDCKTNDAIYFWTRHYSLPKTYKSYVRQNSGF